MKEIRVIQSGDITAISRPAKEGAQVTFFDTETGDRGTITITPEDLKTIASVAGKVAGEENGIVLDGEAVPLPEPGNMETGQLPFNDRLSDNLGLRKDSNE